MPSPGCRLDSCNPEQSVLVRWDLSNVCLPTARNVMCLVFILQRCQRSVYYVINGESRRTGPPLRGPRNTVRAKDACFDTATLANEGKGTCLVALLGPLARWRIAEGYISGLVSGSSDRWFDERTVSSQGWGRWEVVVFVVVGGAACR